MQNVYYILIYLIKTSLRIPLAFNMFFLVFALFLMRPLFQVSEVWALRRSVSLPNRIA